MKKLLPEKLFAFFIAVLVLSISPAMAETEKVNWYTVEIVSFTRAKTAQLKERWPSSRAIDNAINTAGFTPLPAQQPDSLSMLDIEPVAASEKQLGRHAYAINKASGLSVKSHQIWRQKGLPREQAPWINLKSDSPALSGKVRISLSRYLHADFDIQLDNPDWPPAYANQAAMQEESVAKTIDFRVSRKLKRDTIHYIDHPLAGILLRIERYENQQDLPGSGESNSQVSESADKKSTT